MPIVLLLLLLPACLMTPPDELAADPPLSRVIASWDPLACAGPHRVVIELEHDDGAHVQSSVPCSIGLLHIDLPIWGVYYGRVYGWTAGEPIRTAELVTMAVDAPVIHWRLSAPP